MPRRKRGTGVGAGVVGANSLPDATIPSASSLDETFSTSGTAGLVELYYGLQLTPAITLRPNVQYVLDPGGIKADKNVVVLGLKTSISF